MTDFVTNGDGALVATTYGTYPLLTAATADGNGDVYEWPGGVGTLHSYGTFGSGTVTLQASFDQGTTFDAADTTNLAFTADGMANFDLPRCQIRANLAGSSGASVSAVALPHNNRVGR